MFPSPTIPLKNGGHPRRTPHRLQSSLRHLPERSNKTHPLKTHLRASGSTCRTRLRSSAGKTDNQIASVVVTASSASAIGSNHSLGLDGNGHDPCIAREGLGQGFGIAENSTRLQVNPSYASGAGSEAFVGESSRARNDRGGDSRTVGSDGSNTCRRREDTRVMNARKSGREGEGRCPLGKLGTSTILGKNAGHLGKLVASCRVRSGAKERISGGWISGEVQINSSGPVQNPSTALSSAVTLTKKCRPVYCEPSEQQGLMSWAVGEQATAGTRVDDVAPIVSLETEGDAVGILNQDLPPCSAVSVAATLSCGDASDSSGMESCSESDSRDQNSDGMDSDYDSDFASCKRYRQARKKGRTDENCALPSAKRRRMTEAEGRRKGMEKERIPRVERVGNSRRQRLYQAKLARYKKQKKKNKKQLWRRSRKNVRGRHMAPVSRAGVRWCGVTSRGAR